ncbi:uncharacterized protein RJT20DRAFT_147939 [Scheffersomyces xylosifermentans]|uniref:uncharacterized protein n=1 Tax=Scheffersomyces xylosifermentans TaxID=1304137 RepID=UPI00315D9859
MVSKKYYYSDDIGGAEVSNGSFLDLMSIQSLIQRTQRTVVQFIEITDSGVSDQDRFLLPSALSSDLCNLNKHLDFNNQEEIMEYAIRSGFFLSLSRIQIHDTDVNLFNSQAILFKRLISFVLLMGQRSVRFDDEVNFVLAQILGEYLIILDSYESLQPYQKTYLKNLISNVILVFSFHPDILDIWLLKIQNDNGLKHVTTLLRGSRKSRAEFTVTKSMYLPVYHVIQRIVFLEEDVSSFGILSSLISLSKSNELLICWLAKCSNLANIFIDKFFDLFNGIVLVMDPNMALTEKQANRIHFTSKFQEYLGLFFTILEIIPENWAWYFFDFFETQFMNRILDCTEVGPHQAIIQGILFTMISRKKLTPLVKKIFGNSLILDFMHMAWKEKTERDTTLSLLEVTLKHHDQMALELFGTCDVQNESDKVYEPIQMYELRIQCMNVLKQRENSRGGFLLMISSAMSGSFHYFNPLAPFSRMLLQTLLSYFSNPPKVNTHLNELIKDLSVQISLLTNPRFKNTFDYLVEEFLTYNRYCKSHLTSMGTSTGRKYIKTNPILLQLIEIPMDCAKDGDSTIDYDELTSNLELFATLVSHIFICCKIKNLVIQRSFSKTG